MRHALSLLIVSLGVFALIATNGSIFHARADDLTTSIFISICGDGLIQPDELCDAGTGHNVGGYASSPSSRTCMPGCEAYGPYCGDGVLQVQYGEECDDGNNTSGDLCSASCKAETAVLPGGLPTVGSIPSQAATPGTIASALETKVVLHGKAYPSAKVDILLDGQALTTVTADANADFLYSTTAVTPGTATFSFLATDNKGVQSFTSSATFSVLQSAVTTVSNIFIPPSMSVSSAQVAPGALLTLSGQSVPTAGVYTLLSDSASSTLISTADGAGNWALQIDTGSLSIGSHTAKAYFQISSSTKSGYGRAVNFFVGTGSPSSCGSGSDLNGDSKVNLVDFSIFLTDWNSTATRSDFNCDGKVNLADFSIMLFNWTG